MKPFYNKNTILSFLATVTLIFSSFNANAATDVVAERLETQGVLVGSAERVDTVITADTLLTDNPDEGVQVANSDDIAFGSEDFAVSLWVRLDETATGQRRSLIRKGAGGGQWTLGLTLEPNTDHIRFHASTNVTNNLNALSSRPIPVGFWTHLTYAKQGNQLKLYINGQLDATRALDGAIVDNAGDVYIGASPWHVAAKAAYAEVSVYQRLVSSLEAKSLYQAKFNGFNIEEQAVLAGSPSVEQTQQTEGSAIVIDSNDDVGVIPHSINFPTDNRDFTIGFWMRLDQGFTGQWRSVMHKGNTAQERTFALWMRPNDNRLHFRISTDVSWNDGGDSASALSVGQWTHITYVKRGNSLQLYINGQLDATDTLDGNVVANNGPLYIGSTPWNNPAFAAYDRVTSLKRGLQAEAVARLYQGVHEAPHVVGQWGKLIPWPHIAVSAANLPDGRILTWSGSERTIWPRDEQTYSATWDPETNQFLEVFHEGHNMFCAHLAMSEDGNVFVTGGRNQLNSPWASLFDFRDNEWKQIDNMATGGRWYPVTLALPSGEVMTNMGTATNFSNPEKWSADKGWQVLNSVDYSAMRTTNNGTSGGRRWWANLSVAPSGEVFHFWTPQESHLINTEGSGSFRNAETVTNDATVAPGVYVQYDAGKMLITGSNQGSWGSAATRDQAFTVDLNGAAPVIETADSMAFSRVFHNLVPLPTGDVLAIGGNTSGQAFNDTGTVYETEIWNPESRTWQSGAQMSAPRNYHSIALLLKDGRVLSAGGGYCSGNEFCNGASHQNGQIYSPPYLFNADGSLAQRPVISSGPGVIHAGESFSVSGSDDITAFSLVKMSSTTHAVNTDARFTPVEFSGGINGEYTLTPHANPNVLIPGYWMLFGLTAAGVPSEAHIVRIERSINVTTPGPNRYVKFEAQSEVNGNPWTSIAELNILDANGNAIDRSRWQVTADSEEPDGMPQNAVDGNNSTIWHTGWREFAGIDNDPAHPHEMVVDLGGSYVLSGLTYLPRQDMPNGRIADYAVYLSSDGNNWKQVKAGTFLDGTDLKTVSFTINESVAIASPEPSVSGDSFTFSATDVLGLEYQWSFGDGSETGFQSSSSAQHTYSAPGRYIVVLTVRNPVTGEETQYTSTKIVYDTAIDTNNPNRWLASSSILFHPTRNQVWNVNPDNNTVSVIDRQTFSKLAEISVGHKPSALAFAANGDVWVTNKDSNTVSVIDSATRQLIRTISLPGSVFAAKPHGIVVAGDNAYVVQEGIARLLKVSTATGTVLTNVETLPHARHIAKSIDGSQVYVTAFITPLVNGEGSDTPNADGGIRSIEVYSTANLATLHAINMQHSNVEATENSGPGIPNYLGAMALHPAGTDAYIPSKQDNILSGNIRNGVSLSFDQAVRAVSSHIDLQNYQERLEDRIDHDNASVSSAAVYGPYGIHLFTALEGNRQIAVSNTTTDSEILRFNVGRAPQGLSLSADGKTLAVHNFMDRSVTVIDISDIVENGGNTSATLATVDVVASETLDPTVLRGKELFYDSADDRLAALDYMSCAACHNDGSHDGRVWDFTQFGEGIRNTTSLRGKAGMGHGLLHWTGNFDEVQDFEGQIRGFAGGTGLMATTDFLAGTRREPLGDPKAGLSSDLDALASYLASLTESDVSPFYSPEGLSAEAQQGQVVFQNNNCGGCHTGNQLTDSTAALRHDVGTLTTASGERLGGFLDGLDTPSLLGLWNSAPYLHDGSANTIEDAISLHQGVNLSSTQLQQLKRYLLELSEGDSVSPSWQAGRIIMTQPDKTSWQLITFDKAFDQVPVVVAGPVSFAGGQPTTLRVRNITATGFEIQMDEWDYLDGSHIQETIDYMAVVPGNHEIGGLQVFASSIDIDHNWKNITFAQAFEQAPVVISQISSYNGGQAAITRHRAVNSTEFSIRIDEEEKNDRRHAVEKVSVIVIEPGQGSENGKVIQVGKTANAVDHNWTTLNFTGSVTSPLFLGGMQTTNGGDPATVRYRNLTNNSVQVHVDEEQSANTEVGHVKESIGWLLIEP